MWGIDKKEVKEAARPLQTAWIAGGLLVATALIANFSSCDQNYGHSEGFSPESGKELFEKQQKTVLEDTLDILGGKQRDPEHSYQ